MRKLLTLFVLGGLLAGCGSNPVGPDERQLLTQLHPIYVNGNPPNPWYLYDDSLETQAWFKGMAVWDNYLWVTVNPSWTVNPYRGSDCLDVTYANNGGSPTWAELAFIHTPDYSTYASTPGVNISAGGYTKCRFMLRTSVPATTSFQMDGVSAVNIAATTSWQLVTIALPAPATQTAVKTFFQVNTPSVLPLDIFIDDLRYEQ